MSDERLKLAGRTPDNGQNSGDNAWDRDAVLQDYRLAYRSRQASLIGRRETLSGKAKFGIFGDGKEIVQIALAKAFRKGDFRSGYYRDQTLMLALGELTLQEFFAQLYAHADVEAEPATAGRAMNGHYATRLLNPDGSWKNLAEAYNSAADVSPTASQMPRLVGLAYASRLYRELDELKGFTQFSDHGNEVAFGTIGNASTAEGMFWEAVNAIGVLKAPAVITIYDDGYGISVTNEHQMVKEDIGALLSGFQRAPGEHDGLRYLPGDGLGLSCPDRDLPPGSRYGAAGARARPDPRGRADPAAGTFYLWQSRALQTQRTAGVGGRARRAETATHMDH